MATEAKECKVVICDDQKAFREVMSLMLSLEPGLSVVGEAQDGGEAVRIVSELQPDIVLLDIAMPVMDGLEALPLIRRSAPLTQVVMLSGFTSTSTRQRALAEGACLFIEKGTDVPVLVTQIKRLCLRPA